MASMGLTGGAATGTGALSNAVSGISGLYGLAQSAKLQTQVQNQLQAYQQAMSPYSQALTAAGMNTLQANGKTQSYNLAELAALEANPSSVQDNPDYQAGLQAVQRSMAAQGYQGSGNMAQALAKYGSSFYNQQLNEYAALAGQGTQGVVTGANVLAGGASLASPGLQGIQLSNQAAESGIQLAGTSLGSLGYMTKSLGW